MLAIRFKTNPLIRVGDAGVGNNANGPSVIRVPEWINKKLGKFYMYFAHHAGGHIRLAYADHLEGPWRVYEPGTLKLAETPFIESRTEPHIASPDVHIDEPNKRLVMFYHGGYTPHEIPDAPVRDETKLSEREKLMFRQVTATAESHDGITWRAVGGGGGLLGLSYWRRFQWNNQFYAMAMPGVFYLAYPPTDGTANYRRIEVGVGNLFTDRMRHAAILVEGDSLQIFYSNSGDTPEHILMTTVALDRDHTKWRVTHTKSILLPEEPYEGADLPLEPSRRGVVYERARQLRDPCIFVNDGRRYLFYSYAGEQGIAGAELV